MQRRHLLYTTTALLAGMVGLRACGGVFQATQPTADVTARVEADTLAIRTEEVPPGETLQLRAFERPVTLWHRDDAQMAQAARQDMATDWRDPLARLPGPLTDASATDAALTLSSRWFATWNICTRKFCVTRPQEGDYLGFFCPCCASHYDLAGRIRKGIAPRNMQVIPLSLDTSGAVIRLDLRDPPSVT